MEVITASHHPHSSVADQGSLSATSSSIATKVLHESIFTHKIGKKLNRQTGSSASPDTLKDKWQLFSTDCTSLAFGAVEYNALSVDLARGQI